MKTTLLFSGLILLSSTAACFAQQNSTNQNKTSSAAPPNWVKIAGSRSVISVTGIGSKPLQYNPAVNAVSFVHQSSATYSASPNNNNGVIVAEISTNGGLTWDSTCVWSDATLANFPQGALYSAPGNTDVANAYIVVSGKADNGSGSFVGNTYASKQLGSANYNSTISAIPNSVQFLPNTGSFPVTSKHDNSYHSFTSTSDGKVRSIGIVCNDVNSSTNVGFGLRGAVISKGSFNAGSFTWSTDTLIPTTVLRTDGSKQLYKEPLMAWSNNGVTGYVILIGSKAGATGSNKGWQPIIYKTTNSGLSWALTSGINFNAYASINPHLAPVNGSSSLVIPQFSPEEGIDATVDAGGNLHLVTTIRSTLSQHNDSLDMHRTFFNSITNYQWKHVPGQRPYIYDFIGDGTGFWQYALIDSLSTEAPGALPAANGYTSNPWDFDPVDNSKPVSGSRLQLSKSADEKFIVYSWAESDTNFTNLQTKFNAIPNVYARLLNCNGGYFLNSSTQNVTGIPNPNIATRAHFHNASPAILSNGFSMSSTYTVSLPMTITNNVGSFSLTDVTHWYTSDVLSFSGSFATNAITESVPTNVKAIVKESGTINVFPNPFDSKLVIEQSANNKLINKASEIRLFSVDGKEVLNEKVNFTDGVFEINTQTIKPGVYFLQVFADGNLIDVKKVVK